jgi:hypothetical protein
MTNLEFHSITAFKDNIIWALVNKAQQAALIVDPVDVLPVIHFIEKNNFKLNTIFTLRHSIPYECRLTY